jgi:hypothetical protein
MCLKNQIFIGDIVEMFFHAAQIAVKNGVRNVGCAQEPDSGAT